jgi:hypothetical protein
MSITRASADNDCGRRGCLLPHDIYLLTIGSCSAVTKWWLAPPLGRTQFVNSLSQERSGSPIRRREMEEGQNSQPEKTSP